MANLGDQLGVEASDATLHDVLAAGASVEEASYEGPHGMTVVPGGSDLESFSEADISRMGRVVGSFADRDFVFVDTGAGLSHETALPLGLSDEVLLVSTADRDALGNTEKTRRLAERLGADVAGVVLTRVTPGDAPGDAAPLSAPVLGSVPEDAALHAASDGSVPVTDYDADAPAAAAFRSIAGSLADGPVEAPGDDAEFAADAGESIEGSVARTETAGVAAEEVPDQPSESPASEEPRTQNRREGATRGTPQGQQAATQQAGADAAVEGQDAATGRQDAPAGSWEDSPAWAEQPAEDLQQAGGDIPSAEGGVDVTDDAAFEDAPQAAPLAEETEAESSTERKGFISRLFS
jgi:septum site-determining protein MinD